MPLHLPQSVLQKLIPMLVVLSIVAALPAGKVDLDQEPPTHVPAYEFAYGVQDPLTGDHKDQWERRDADRVKGVYMLEESDGTQRIVEYEADDAGGFRAIVTRVELRKDLDQASSGGVRKDTIAHSYNMLRAVSF